MSPLVHVVAMGARTPVGLTAEASAAAVRAGISRISEHPFLVDLRGRPVRLARDGILEPGLFGAARVRELARSALGEVVAKLAACPGLRGEVPLLVALPEPRPGLGAADGEALAQDLAQLPGAGRWLPRALPLGNAAALEALRAACSLVVEGRSDLCIAGGADSWLDPDALLWLDGQDRLAAEGVRGGFPPGEGAAFLAVASDAARRALELPSLGVVRAVHAGRDVERADDAATLGTGLAEAIAVALAASSRSGELPHEVYCDLDGERARNEDWGFAALRASRALGDATLCPNGLASWGNPGAAWGALLAVLALQARRRGYARGPGAILCACSDGGLKAAALVESRSNERGIS